MDVEAENRELVSRLEQAVSVSRRLDAALNEIKTYAKEVEQLHVDIQAERSKNRELQQQLEAATLAAASTSPALAGSCYFPTTAHGSHEDDTNPAAAAARWQARCSQLESELNLSRRDVARTEQMLHHEIGRLRQELEDSHRDMARVQQSQETQAELFRLRLDELQMVSVNDMRGRAVN